ncbi:MAG: hypothetical protein AAFX94_10615, partial [Myxococcota bacterium]
MEHVRAGDAGIDLSWAVVDWPRLDGDLTIAVSFEGMPAQLEESGIHFSDSKTDIARVRIGGATFIDAAGKRTPIAAAIHDSSIEYRVPEAVL